jgi:hypothetical protein
MILLRGGGAEGDRGAVAEDGGLALAETSAVDPGAVGGEVGDGDVGVLVLLAVPLDYAVLIAWVA